MFLLRILRNVIFGIPAVLWAIIVEAVSVVSHRESWLLLLGYLIPPALFIWLFYGGNFVTAISQFTDEFFLNDITLWAGLLVGYFLIRWMQRYVDVEANRPTWSHAKRITGSDSFDGAVFGVGGVGKSTLLEILPTTINAPRFSIFANRPISAKWTP